MGIHPRPDGSPEVSVLIAEAAARTDVMFDLQQLGRSSVLLPRDIVVQLNGHGRIRLVRCAPQELNERPLRLVEVAEGREPRAVRAGRDHLRPALSSWGPPWGIPQSCRIRGRRGRCNTIRSTLRTEADVEPFTGTSGFGPARSAAGAGLVARIGHKAATVAGAILLRGVVLVPRQCWSREVSAVVCSRSLSSQARALASRTRHRRE